MNTLLALWPYAIKQTVDHKGQRSDWGLVEDWRFDAVGPDGGGGGVCVEESILAGCVLLLCQSSDVGGGGGVVVAVVVVVVVVSWECRQRRSDRSLDHGRP